MSRPHEELRSEETIDASELLDEDGSVDLSAVRSRQVRGGKTKTASAAECARWRRTARGANSIQASDIDTEFADSTVADHVRGDCYCEHDEPALTYNGVARNGVWHRPEDGDA